MPIRHGLKPDTLPRLKRTPQPADLGVLVEDEHLLCGLPGEVVPLLVLTEGYRAIQIVEDPGEKIDM